MSIVLTTTSRSAARPTSWIASALANYARNRREELNLSAARAAELSGIEVSEWYALEEGWVPEDRAVIQAIAATLRVRWTEVEALAFLVRLAQQPA